MNVGSLFSGIGGLDHGLHNAGFQHVFFCESDQWRRGVLAHHWPGVPIYEDVRGVADEDARRRSLHRTSGATEPDQGDDRRNGRGEAPPSIDLLCGGFPCQDLSVAGKRAGFGGARSSLFFEFARIADALRPRWLLIENVPGLFTSCGCAGCRRCRSLLRWHQRRGCPGTWQGAQLSLDGNEQTLDAGPCAGCRTARQILERHNGTDFAVVRAALRELGYGVAWRVVDSRYFGVPQRRRRVFIVGALSDGDPRAAAERAGQVLAVGTRCSRHPATSGEKGPNTPVASLSGLGDGDPDDNAGQAGPLVVPALTTRAGNTQDDQQTGQLVASPLSHGSNPNSNMSGRRREDDLSLVTAFHQTQDPIHGEELSPALGVTSIGMGVAFSDNQRAEVLETPIARQLTSGGGKPGQGYSAVRQGASVRRLTPTECERLQDLPDGWTDHGADSRRYAALGDAVTSSVGEWIGRRILEADKA